MRTRVNGKEERTHNILYDCIFLRKGNKRKRTNAFVDNRFNAVVGHGDDSCT